MAYIEGLINRITSGEVFTEAESYTAYTGDFNMDAGGVGNFTSDKEVVMNKPDEAEQNVSNDYIPVVALDKSKSLFGCELLKPDKPKTTKLADFLDADKRNQVLQELLITDSAVIFNCTVKQGNAKADDNEGYVTVKSNKLKFVGADNNPKTAKSSIRLEQTYGSELILKITIPAGLPDKSTHYIDFYADDNDMLFFSVSNVFCGRIALIYKEPLFKKIYSAYPKPYNKKPCNEDHFNQCAIRMSMALINAGIPIEGVKNLTNPGGNTYCKHKHVLGAYNLAMHIDKMNFWDKRTVYDGSKTDISALVVGKTGILYFENFKEENAAGQMTRSSQYRHIEVWNGYALVSGFDRQMFEATVIKFWEIK